MALRHISTIAIAAAALAGSSPSMAQQYRPDDYLGLDLSRAVLSPALLGPAQSFTPGPLDATVDRAENSVHATAEPVAEGEITPQFADRSVRARLRASTSGKSHARVERSASHKPRALALHGRNPLEAQARDSSIHVWPCKSGGICSWKR